MKLGLITGGGFVVLAVLVFLGSDIGKSLGGIAFVLVLLILGIALIISAYLQPSLKSNKSGLLPWLNLPFRTLITVDQKNAYAVSACRIGRNQSATHRTIVH